MQASGVNWYPLLSRMLGQTVVVPAITVGFMGDS